MSASDRHLVVDQDVVSSLIGYLEDHPFLNRRTTLRSRFRSHGRSVVDEAIDYLRDEGVVAEAHTGRAGRSLLTLRGASHDRRRPGEGQPDR